MYSEQEAQQLKQFGMRIRALRQAHGFSQESFADACQMHRTYMGGIERGERNLSLLNILKIAATLNLSPSELFAELPIVGNVFYATATPVTTCLQEAPAAPYHPQRKD